jgi:site-specific DNA-methyltransferase (adenine-specific)
MTLPVNKIICGDCLKVMKDWPDKCVDLVLTDPPYGLNYNNGDLAHQREKVFGGDISQMKARPIVNDGEDDAMRLFEEMLLVVGPKLLKGGCCCCCCCCCGGGGPKPLFAKWTLLMDKYIGFKQAVVWDKGGLGMGIHYRRNYEFVLIAQKGSPAKTWNGGNTTPNVWRIPKIIPSAEQHPTEKPVELMAKVIQIHSDPGDLILDPFCGSGTTCVAAKMLGRRYIGIDISPEYCAIAEERLKAVNTGVPVKEARAGQAALFGV